MSKEIDGQRGFAQMLEASRASAREVLFDRGEVLATKRAEPVELEKIL
ncbi:MAG: hypothetical protein ACE145_08605 [Terriglobia bacterium]